MSKEKQDFIFNLGDRKKAYRYSGEGGEGLYGDDWLRRAAENGRKDDRRLGARYSDLLPETKGRRDGMAARADLRRGSMPTVSIGDPALGATASSEWDPDEAYRSIEEGDESAKSPTTLRASDFISIPGLSGSTSTVDTTEAIEALIEEMPQLFEVLEPGGAVSGSYRGISSRLVRCNAQRGFGRDLAATMSSVPYSESQRTEDSVRDLLPGFSREEEPRDPLREIRAIKELTGGDVGLARCISENTRRPDAAWSGPLEKTNSSLSRMQAPRRGLTGGEIMAFLDGEESESVLARSSGGLSGGRVGVRKAAEYEDREGLSDQSGVALKPQISMPTKFSEDERDGAQAPQSLDLPLGARYDGFFLHAHIGRSGEVVPRPTDGELTISSDMGGDFTVD